MKRNNRYSYPTGNILSVRFRSLLLVVPALMAFAVAGSSGSAMARGGTPGTITITADSVSNAPGTMVSFTIALHNGSQAGWVTVDNHLPPHTTLVSAPGCDTSGSRTVSCSFPMFAGDDASATVTVLVDADANCHANLRNTARVSGWRSADADIT
ncbi:MAG: hypothetical protein ACJ78Q_02275, partial [Chloroflexia bacterium]